MKKTLRIAAATLITLSFVFALMVLVQPATEAARADYKCCTYWVLDDDYHKAKAYGVWINGRCVCSVMTNPNNCRTYCVPAT